MSRRARRFPAQGAQHRYLRALRCYQPSPPSSSLAADDGVARHAFTVHFRRDIIGWPMMNNNITPTRAPTFIDRFRRRGMMAHDTMAQAARCLRGRRVNTASHGLPGAQHWQAAACLLRHWLIESVDRSTRAALICICLAIYTME